MNFMTKKLIDSTILVYAYDNSDPKKHEIAKEVVKKLEENGDGVLSIQNLAEFSRALTEKAKPPRPYHEVRRYILQLESVYTIITYGSNTVAEALHIASNYNLHFYDALIAATMEEGFISEIVTENTKDFRKVPNIVITNPFE